MDVGGGRRRGLEEALRTAVLAGRLRPGTRLPSTRSLAGELGWARGTVVEAYEQLVAEGYLASRRGGPTTVAVDAAAAVTAEPVEAAAAPPRHDLRPGLPDLSSFPRGLWLAAQRRMLRSAPAELLGYGDPRGQAPLRQALAAYLGRTRGVRIDARNLLVCGGWSQGLALLCQFLRRRGARAIAFEDPSWNRHREIVIAQDLEIVRLPVDGEGARLDLLSEGIAAAVVTPAHQAALGVPMAAARRARLLAWARENDGLVIEDDYDCEFRYDRAPVGALQGLAPDHVVHAGTVSKTLAPGLRIGWLSVPPHLTAPLLAIKDLSYRHNSTLDQLTLAELIESGDYDRHIRRMRARYRRRRDLLVATLAERVPQVRVAGIAAGVHALLELPRPGPSEARVLAAAERRSLAIMGLSHFRHRPRPDDLQAIVAGYGAPPEHRYRECLEALVDVLRDSLGA